MKGKKGKERRTIMKNSSSQQVAMRVSTVSIIVNLLLSLGKLLAGVIGHSGAMVSDAIHSASDVLSTFVVIAGVKISGKEADKEHCYGHERYECVASIILAAVLAGTGLGIGYAGIQKITNGNYGLLVIPETIALVAAVLSIIAKEAMYWYTRAAAKKINSSALMADAWHHRSDALSSIGSFIGILGARMGFPIMDPIASVVICLFILKASLEIFLDAVGKMTDESCDEEIEEQMKQVIASNAGVISLDEFRTRKFGSKVYVDVEIGVDRNLKFEEAHDIAEEIHEGIEKEFCDVKHCMVHANPVESKK
ncbi:Cobalt-zinc-cadmium resistance protein [Lachnospiraceae bacterium TWA4]|nr:Cobalt-zinc-cadmium resistance protein [Lachnospiraceae bacterium TWA4]